MRSHALTLLLCALSGHALAQSPTMTPVPPRAVPAVPATPATPATPDPRATAATPAIPARPATPSAERPAVDAPDRVIVLTRETATRGANVSVSSRPNDPIAAGYRPAFRALDTDQDGALSRREAAGNPTLVAQFVALDLDRDRVLSRAETENVIN